MRWTRTGSIIGISLLLWCHWPKASAFEITQISQKTNGIAIQWSAEAGRSYQVETADSLLGPWQRRASVNAASNLLSWLDTETGSARQRFYRLSTTNETGLRGALLAGDAVPRTVGSLSFDINSVAADAVFAASQLGAGGAQLVTTGTLSQQGQTWSYSSSPADRLAVRFGSGTNADFYITRMEGNFSSDAATFLQESHNFDFRVVAPGVADLTFNSGIPSGTCNFHATARGSLLWNGVNYTVDLALDGQYCFESGFGSYSLLNDYTTAGTVMAPGYSLSVDQRWRFELVADQKQSASSAEDWNNNTLTIGADTFKWVNAKKQKSFKNGKPSSIDSYWQASGAVLKNGQSWGLYQYQGPIFGYVKFYLATPDAAIELESWNVL